MLNERRRYTNFVFKARTQVVNFTYITKTLFKLKRRSNLALGEIPTVQEAVSLSGIAQQQTVDRFPIKLVVFDNQKPIKFYSNNGLFQKRGIKNSAAN